MGQAPVAAIEGNWDVQRRHVDAAQDRRDLEGRRDHHPCAATTSKKRSFLARHHHIGTRVSLFGTVSRRFDIIEYARDHESNLAEGERVMSPTPKAPKRPDKAPLPKPNVDLSPSEDGDVTPEQVRALFCNPLFTGIAHFPKVVDDETWVRAAMQAIREHGAEQWLVNMLYVLREFLRTNDAEPDDE